ncbi:Protein of unknown function DUF2134, membrane [Burkholderia sp. lig30]|jgi:uncharacterized membrane protein|uniref:TadG family pilus assembly protein n=1 Tax=Burkholderia sp. lig30 TaxID=1192124 RepID=UPI000461C473|nr:TadG family pilus assembly protein [Burkholderia sp. lig30]KDB08822.1 Protein of unknown function DUF2134, membrane [Burkholderia sp. lig30]
MSPSRSPAFRTLRRVPPRARRQRGAASILAAVWALVAIVALGAIDIGNVFFTRRDLQRVADVAALAAAQRMDDQCAQPVTTANANAASNGFNPQASGQSLSIVCGRWDVSANPTPPYFAAASGQLNAVQVTVTKQVPYFFFGPARTVSATSTAKAANPDAFTIGTSLVSLQNGLLNSVLGALLGANLNLTAVSYQGLATTQISLQDLVVAAGVGTVDQLANVSVTAGQFAQLLVNALSRTQVANVNASVASGALQTIVSLATGGASLNVLSNGSTPGVLAIGLANRQAAADARINLLDAVMVAAEVAAANAAASGQPPINVNTGINLGVLNATLQLQIVQPPVMAIGEGGRTPAGVWRTQASTAQVRLFLNVDLGTTGNFEPGLLSPLFPVVALLGALFQLDVHLPLYLEVSPGTAWLQSTSCAPTKAASLAVVGVQTGLANLCVGDAPTGMTATTQFSCPNPATLVSVGVLGLPPLLQVKANVALPAMVPASSATTMVFHGDTDYYQSTNSNAVGSVLTNALSGVAQSLAAPNGLALYVAGLAIPVGTLLAPVVGLLTAALSPLLAALDQVIVPLLNLLGAQIGSATVHNVSLTCGVAQIVN